MSHTTPLYAHAGHNLTTNEYAAENLVKPQTVRKRYSQTGSYFGDVPVKLPNGRLQWRSSN